MPKASKLAWVPTWLENSQKARVALSVLVDKVHDLGPEEWEGLWEERVRELAKEEDVRDLELVKVWEDLEGGRPQVQQVQDLLNLLEAKLVPALWDRLCIAQGEGKEAEQAKKRLLAKFPQEDPAPSQEERLQELREAGLNGLVSAVADPSPAARARGGL